MVRDNRVDYVLSSAFFLVAGIVFATVNGMHGIVSLLHSCTFLLTVLAYIRAFNRIPLAMHGLILITLITVLINSTLSGIGDLNYYRKVIIFITSILWLVSCASTSISRQTMKCLLLANILISILYILFADKGLTFNVYSTLLTYNFSNPNLAGMFIANSILYLCLTYIATPHIIHKKLLVRISKYSIIAIIAAVISYLFLTGNRSSVMVIILFGVLLLIDYIFKGKRWLNKWGCLFIAMAPIIFVFIYANFATEVTTDVSFGMDVEGKTATSRNSVWNPILNNLFHYFWYGDYFGLGGYSGMSQMHNTHMDVFASYGIIPLILFITILYKVLCISAYRSHTRLQRYALYAFIGTFANHCFEAAFVSGSEGLYIFTGGFLLFTNYNNHYKTAAIRR